MLRGPWLCGLTSGCVEGAAWLVITIKPLKGKKKRLSVKNSAYAIIKNVCLHIYALRA